MQLLISDKYSIMGINVIIFTHYNCNITHYGYRFPCCVVGIIYCIYCTCAEVVCDKVLVNIQVLAVMSVSDLFFLQHCDSFYTLHVHLQIEKVLLSGIFS